MFFAVDENGVRTYIDDADANRKYFCPACNAQLVQKRGNIVTHHFAHKSNGICDLWYSGKMSAWHKKMQNLFPRIWQEVLVYNDLGEYHIADVVFKKNSIPYVIEFQHSSISSTDFISHTGFYMSQGYRVIWIFDFCNVYPSKQLYYIKEDDSNEIHVFWPGKGRLRFLDRVDISPYVNNLYIFFYVSSGKGYSKIDDYYGHTLWNYIDPFNRETLFIKLDLYSFETTRDFYALPYSDEEFQRVLKNIGKCQEKSMIDSKTTKSGKDWVE